MPEAARPVSRRLHSCERCAAASASASLPAHRANVQRERLAQADGHRVHLRELALGRLQIAQCDQTGHAPFHRLGLKIARA